ncbi:insulinase family protein [Myxococcota bacterium]|nr:insulinase family protein [Myxococcota bacterium]
MSPRPSTPARAASALALLVLLATSSSAAKGGKPPGAPSPPAAPPAAATVEVPTDPPAEPWRATRPVPGPEPEFRAPDFERFVLPNGLEVLLSTRRELPLVTASLVFRSGSAADPPGKEGLAQFTASMLDEGTRSLDALTLSERLKRLATDVGTDVDLETTSLHFDALSDKLDESWEIVAEMLASPTFPQGELDRVRKLLQADVVARRARPEVIAGRVFRRALFGAGYAGRPTEGSEASLAALTRKDLVAFHAARYAPNDAVLAVVGNVDRATLEPMLVRHLGTWKKRKVRSIPAPEVTAATGVRVLLVDKPGASQSQVRVGNVGVPRTSPLYYPTLIANAAFGGMFTSRINLNLREDKGYTYGARSGFEYWPSTGMWVVSAPVKAGDTRESVAEILKEIRELAGERPLSPAERDYAASSLVRGYPSSFETQGGTAGRLATLGWWRLPDSWLEDHPAAIRSVTAEQANAAARQVIRPDHLVVVVVGDRATVEEPLRSLGHPVTVVDEEGIPVPAGPG